jgi:tRNA (guanine37-N1)-methyltransferase
VLSGGEIAAMAIIDATVRLVPGVLGHEDSAEQDSFSSGMLDHPHYTRPAVFRGMSVPDVLLSGDHGRIDQWRTEQARKRTQEARADLIEEPEDQTETNHG